MFLRTVAREAASQWTPRVCSEEIKEEPGHMGIFAEKICSWTSKDYADHKIQASQISDFSTFMCMGRCKSLGSLKSFLTYAPQLSWASTLHFSHPLLPWDSPQWVAAVLMAARSQVFFSFLNALGVRELTFVGLESLITVASLFIDITRNTPIFNRNTERPMSKNNFCKTWNCILGSKRLV